MKPFVDKLVSGGQTGADRAALDWAIAHEILLPIAEFRFDDGRSASQSTGMEGSSHQQGGRKDWVIKTIALFKLAKALLLIASAVGMLSLVHKDMESELMKLVNTLNVDPDSRYFQGILEKVSGLSPRKLKGLGIGSFFYAGVFIVEGVGLWLRKRWAEYFTLIVTGSFVPLEVYELIKKFSALKVLVIIVNLAIVAYLIWRLRHHRKS